MRHSMVPDRQDKSQERVDCSAGVDPQKDQEANQMSLPSGRLRDRDLYRARFRESKAQQLTRHTMPVRLAQRNAIWMSQNGISPCAWHWRDTIAKINARKGRWNLHGTDRSKTRYMKVVTNSSFLRVLNQSTDNPPEPLRPSSRASGSVVSHRSTTPTNLFWPTSLKEVNEQLENTPSRRPSGSRPRGPRSPSPLPPSPRASPEPDFESLDTALEITLHNLNRPPATPPKPVSPLPRSRRQPFEPTGNTDAVPRVISHGLQKAPSTIEPLSIKKKNSLRNPTGESPPGRKAHLRTPSNIRGRVVSPRRVSPIVRQKKTTAPSSSREDIDVPKLLKLVESTKDEVASSSGSLLHC